MSVCFVYEYEKDSESNLFYPSICLTVFHIICLSLSSYKSENKVSRYSLFIRLFYHTFYHVCLSVTLYICLSHSLSIYLPATMPICLSVYLSLLAAVYLYVCMSHCISVCVTMNRRKIIDRYELVYLSILAYFIRLICHTVYMSCFHTVFLSVYEYEKASN